MDNLTNCGHVLPPFSNFSPTKKCFLVKELHNKFLAKEEVMFDGKILSEDDKEKITNVLAAIFMDAKKKNRRS